MSSLYLDVKCWKLFSTEAVLVVDDAGVVVKIEFLSISLVVINLC